MDPRSGREGESGVVPSAKFLQARITALSTTLIKRLENIFAASLDEAAVNSSVSGGTMPPSLTDTAVQQFQLDVESTALVKAAEEIMMLTRTMKEIWLFGGLNTIRKQSEKGQDDNSDEKAAAEIEDLEKGIREFLERCATNVATEE